MHTLIRKLLQINRHNHKVHHKLYQGTQSIYNIQQQHTHKWWRVLTPYLTFTMQTYPHPEHCPDSKPMVVRLRFVCCGDLSDPVVTARGIFEFREINENIVNNPLNNNIILKLTINYKYL